MKIHDNMHTKWCVFTSAGDHNAISLWVEPEMAQSWTLIVAYYGDSDDEFSRISKMSSYAFRTKGSKFQNLKKLVDQNPNILNEYKRVWVCDDDIQMSAAQIHEAFSLSEEFDFWIAQPAFLPNGKISHRITEYAGSRYDYRIVNFIEVNTPIFRRDKLAEFLKVYDGRLPDLGVDYWYMTVLGANRLNRFSHFSKTDGLGRFAIIDRVQVINPHDDKKGRNEIDQFQRSGLRFSAYLDARDKYGIIQFRHKVFARRKTTYRRNWGCNVTSHDAVKETTKQVAIDLNRIYQICRNFLIRMTSTKAELDP